MGSYFRCPWPQCPTPFLRHSHTVAERHIAWAKAAGVWMCPWRSCPNPYSQSYHNSGLLSQHQVNAGLSIAPGGPLPDPSFVEPPPTSVLAAGARLRPADRALRKPRVLVESGSGVRNVTGRLQETTPIYDSVIRDLGVDPVGMKLMDNFEKLLNAGIMKPPENVQDVNHLFSL